MADTQPLSPDDQYGSRGRERSRHDSELHADVRSSSWRDRPPWHSLKRGRSSGSVPCDGITRLAHRPGVTPLRYKIGAKDGVNSASGSFWFVSTGAGGSGAARRLVAGARRILPVPLAGNAGWALARGGEESCRSSIRRGGARRLAGRPVSRARTQRRAGG